MPPHGAGQGAHDVLQDIVVEQNADANNVTTAVKTAKLVEVNPICLECSTLCK